MIRVGEVIVDRFVVLAMGATGGMGAVYRARDQLTGSVVAVKVLHGPSGNAEARFQREARVLSQLAHDAIVSYVHHGTTEAGAPFLAMEWLEGEDLDARLARGPLAPVEVLGLGGRIAGALAHLHARGLVHRDVKPANVLLEHGEVRLAKLLDLGIVHTHTVALTGAGTSIGTPGYMSPEQVRGEAGIDPRTDVFALGCVLYECLAGQPAFVGATPFASMVKILAEEPVPLATLASAPRSLTGLVHAMLAKDPGARPGSMLEVQRALEAAETMVSPTRTSLPPASLTSAERRLVCVILASGQVADLEANPLAPTIDSGAPETHWLLELQQLGARLERLADGSTATLLSGGGAATDLVARAARAALVLRRALPASSIVLATGQAETSAQFPVGEAIDRAARLLRAAPAPAIVIDEITARLIDGRFEVRTANGVAELVAERDVAPPRRLGRGATPLIGRGTELRALQATYDECTAESVARLVVVTGEQGIGKSRLEHAFREWAATHGTPPRVWSGRGEPASAGGVLLLARQVARRALGLVRGASAAEDRAEILDRAQRLAPKEPLLAEFLGEIAGVAFPDAESASLRATRADPRAMGDRLRTTWTALLGATLGAGPLVITLDDVHWADAASMALVHLGLRAHRDRPLMILALGRAETTVVHPALSQHPGGRRLDLDRLPARAATALVRSIVGDRAEEAVVNRLVDRGGGNPFQLEELSLAAGSDGKAELPPSVSAILQARLDALDAETRRVLRAASVLGGDLDADALGHLLGIEPGDQARREALDGRLETLVEREMLVRASTEPDAPCAFRQEVLCEVAYGTLTDADRILGHRLAGEYLERSHATHPAVLAHHFERGAAPERAAGMWLRAARLGIDANDFASAVARAEAGIACGAKGVTLTMLELARSEALYYRGDLAESLEVARAAIDRSPVDAEWFPMACLTVVAASEGLGLRDEAISAARRLASVELRPSSAARFVQIATKLLVLGEREVSASILERVRSAPFAAGDDLLEGRMAFADAIVAQRDGDVGRLTELDERASRAYARAHLDREATQAMVNAGAGQMALGRYAAAAGTTREAIRRAEALDLVRLRAFAVQNLAGCLHRLGELDAAWECTDDAMRVFAAVGEVRMRGIAHASRARIALALSSDVDVALVEARAGVAILDAFPLVRTYALGTLAAVLRAAGAIDQALASANLAVQLLTQHGTDSGEFLTRLVHAEILHETGSSAAGPAIREARSRLLGQAARIVDVEGRRSFLEDVSEHRRILALAEEWVGAASQGA